MIVRDAVSTAEQCFAQVLSEHNETRGAVHIADLDETGVQTNKHAHCCICSRAQCISSGVDLQGMLMRRGIYTG